MEYVVRLLTPTFSRGAVSAIPVNMTFINDGVSSEVLRLRLSLVSGVPILLPHLRLSLAGLDVSAK